MNGNKRKTREEYIEEAKLQFSEFNCDSFNVTVPLDSEAHTFWFPKTRYSISVNTDSECKNDYILEILRCPTSLE